MQIQNVNKTKGENRFGGIKHKMFWTLRQRLSACPSLKSISMRTLADDFKYLQGDFVFKNPTKKFNSFEFDISKGDLNWKTAVNNPAANIFEISFELTISTLDKSFYQFIEKYLNSDLVLILKRTNCEGEIFMFGGCCQPAQLVLVEGGLGADAKSFAGTKLQFQAYSIGLPPVLSEGINIPEYEEEQDDGDYDQEDFDLEDFY